MRCVAQRGEEAARLGQALTGPGCQDEALHRTTAPFCTACRHPLYMPEGIEGKLGDFPCYDPAKVCVTLQADCVLTPEEVGDAKAPLCTHESKSQRGYRRSRPPWKSLAPCACASRRGARTCAAVQPAAAPPSISISISISNPRGARRRTSSFLPSPQPTSTRRARCWARPPASATSLAFSKVGGGGVGARHEHIYVEQVRAPATPASWHAAAALLARPSDR